MGFWGYKISQNDGTADVLLDWGDKYFKKYKSDKDDIIDWKNVNISKTDFKKAFTKMLNSAKIKSKNHRDIALYLPFVVTTSKGCFNLYEILGIYVIGRNVGFVFPKDFLNLAKAASFQLCASFDVFSEDLQEEIIKMGLAISRSIDKKGKLNLMKYF